MKKAVQELNRRAILGSIGLMGLSQLIPKVNAQKSCHLTPEQTQGPFYPIADQLDKDNDLTRMAGSNERAIGEVVIVKGLVQNQECTPIKGALVEIWQACETGKYNHPGDPNNAKIDPNFQYWGRCLTNDAGEYVFKTIIPGAYPATSTWMRPPHIHFKVHLRGHSELTTQMYWKDNPLNHRDRILMAMSEEDRQSVLVSFKKEAESIHKIGHFNLVLQAF